MRTLKKIGRAIAKKFKNWNGTTTAKEAAIEESRTSNVPEDVEVKGQEEVINVEKATAQLCENINENSEDLNISQPTCETSEKAQNSSIETPNATDSSSLAVCFDGNATDKKDNPSTKTTQQRQAILAGFVGTALLAASVALCILEMHVVAVVGGIVGLVCMGFALHNAIKPNTKLEKVEDIEQLTTQPCLNPMQQSIPKKS